MTSIKAAYRTRTVSQISRARRGRRIPAPTRPTPERSDGPRPTIDVESAVLLAGSAAAAVAGPQRATAGPPPYRLCHGAFEVMVLSDGHLVLPTSLLAPDAPFEERSAILQAGGSTAKDYEPAANITLIRSGGDVILFDTGGVDYQSQTGMLSKNLITAGIEPAHITKVVFTHGHPDHIWGTVLAGGELRFPNAAYYSGAKEWDFWTGADVWTKLPSAQYPFAIGAQRQYAAVRDRVTMRQPGDDVVTGICVIDTSGHTPGHISCEVAGREGLIIVGDVVTAPWVYFPHPEWKFGFDADHDTAIASRKRLLDRAAGDRTKLIGYHWPYPGVGFAERSGSAYRYAAVT